MKNEKKVLLFLLRHYANTLALFSEIKAGEWTMELFFTPRKGRLTDENRQTLSSATWESLMLDGVKIQTYRWEGKGETVLLAHGWESNAARWQQWAKKLRKQGYTVIALDAPAHGESGSPQFNAFLYAEMIKSVVERFAPSIIIGHSVGGFATAFYATHFLHPSVKRLVLMASPSELNQIFDKFLHTVDVSKKVKRGFYRKLELMFGHPIEYFSIKTLVKSLTINGLVLHDKTDDICKFEDGEQIHANWQGSNFIATEGYGHTLRHEDIQKMVLEYLQKELA